MELSLENIDSKFFFKDSMYRNLKSGKYQKFGKDKKTKFGNTNSV